MSSETAVVVSEGKALSTMANPPSAVLAEAKTAATALADVIRTKPKPVIMNGEQYLEFEDWQTLGRFYGVTAGEEHEPEFVNLGGIKGFKATAVALRNGEVISRATAYCMDDEEKWGSRTKYEWHYVLKSGGTSLEDPGRDELVWEDNPKKPGGKRPVKQRVQAGQEKVPLYQLASMAQTRANAKALRNVLSWVAVLGGYKPTPAEEIPEGAEKTGEKPENPAPPRGEPGKAVSCRFCAGMAHPNEEGTAYECEACGKGWNAGR